VVIARHAHPGETVPAGARLVTVADLGRVRVEAEVDEFDVGRVAPGAPVSVTAEGFPGAAWRGTVEEIPDAVSPPAPPPRGPRAALRRAGGPGQDRPRRAHPVEARPTRGGRDPRRRAAPCPPVPLRTWLATNRVSETVIRAGRAPVGHGAREPLGFAQ